ncbi:MAG: hypothetical protein QNK05_20945 [Myxococcota bacterium]|nr:hypothetical protein [Myxococcota bacterium]
MSGWLFYPVAAACIAAAVALVLGRGGPRQAPLWLAANALGLAVLCAGLGAFWIGALQVLLLGVAASALLSLASAEPGSEDREDEPRGFPLTAVLGTGVALTALLWLGGFVAGLDLPAADRAPGFGRVAALSFWLFADRALAVAGLAFLALGVLLGVPLWSRGD